MLIAIESAPLMRASSSFRSHVFDLFSPCPFLVLFVCLICLIFFFTADFGLSKLIRGHQHPMRTVCGTWAYCVAAETELRCVDAHGKAGVVQAQHVTRS